MLYTRVLFCCLLLTCAVSAQAAPPEPLDAAGRAALAAAVEDPAPKVLLGQAPGLENKHYLIGNEWHLDLYAPKLKDLGGAYIGVGSDQAYFLMGMARPAVAWLIDYDDLVVQLHKVYFAFFAEAATPDAFMLLWTDETQGAPVLTRRLQGDVQAAELVKFYRRQRGRVVERLTRVSKTFAKAGVANFVKDEEAYAWTRAMVTGGRVRALRVDLLAKQGMLSIGEAARKMGWPVRALYLSNAENYWSYSKQFRANIAGLPMDERSVIVRTVSTWGQNADYSYTLQPGLNYQAWLSKPWVREYRDFVRGKQPKAGEFLFYETHPDPDAAERARGKRVGTAAHK